MLRFLNIFIRLLKRYQFRGRIEIALKILHGNNFLTPPNFSISFNIYYQLQSLTRRRDRKNYPADSLPYYHVSIALKDNFLVPQVLTLLLTYYYPSIWKSVADTWKDLGPVVRSLVSANCWRDIKTYRFRWLALTMLRATRACQGPVSRKSRDFSGAFRVT